VLKFKEIKITIMAFIKKIRPMGMVWIIEMAIY
jgi:hypothetical protein